MKFYRIVYQVDPAAADVFFPTRKQAQRHINETYAAGSGDAVEIEVLEHKGKLTKKAVCSLLTYWPQR